MFPILQVLITLFLKKKQVSEFCYWMVEMKMSQTVGKRKFPNEERLKTLHSQKKKRAGGDITLFKDWNQNTKLMI